MFLCSSTADSSHWAWTRSREPTPTSGLWWESPSTWRHLFSQRQVETTKHGSSTAMSLGSDTQEVAAWCKHAVSLLCCAAACYLFEVFAFVPQLSQTQLFKMSQSLENHWFIRSDRWSPRGPGQNVTFSPEDKHELPNSVPCFWEMWDTLLHLE